MFTDLVDSTGLADSMDPEDFRALIEAHRTVAVAPILRYGGVVARYLGDGMLVLFGYPEAHEDDAERAVRAGLRVAQATAEMNQRWIGEGKGRIAVRVGVHTGIVVVGDVLKADVQEKMAVFGNAPSIAARLQALAEPNSILLSGTTKSLLPPVIRCETRGNTILKGVSSPVEIFMALDVRKGVGDRRAGGRVLPFVNREKELATIRQCWAAARRGEGQCLVIEGEPGIGKSRLVRAVEERIVTQPSRWMMARTSSYAANTDFFAFAELFRQIFPFDEKAEVSSSLFGNLRATLERQGVMDPEIAIGLASLIGIMVPEDEETEPLQPERRRALTLNAITAWFQNQASLHPLVLVIEDLHWADASTCEAIARLKTDLRGHRVFLLMTTRPNADADAYGITATVTDEEPAVGLQEPRAITGSNGSKVISLTGLRPASAEMLLSHVLQSAELQKATVTTLLQRANGVPLYLEELPKPVLDANGDTGRNSIEIPITLRDSLMAQLDRMGEAKNVAQTAAVLGHSFARTLLEHVWHGDSDALDLSLAVLGDAALVCHQGDGDSDSYGFRHALLAEIAYDSLLREERRKIHRRTADALVLQFQQISKSRPELVASHYGAAGASALSFDYWMEAGRLAALRSANAEAAQHYKNAELELDNLTGADLALQEERKLALYLARAPVLSALLGWAAPEVEGTYMAILQIAQSNKDRLSDQFHAWIGLCNVYLLQGNLDDARKAINRMEEISSTLDVEDLKLRWHRLSGFCNFLSGHFEAAVEHYDKTLLPIAAEHQAESSSRRNTNVSGVDPSIIGYSIKAWSHWFIGQNDKADDASMRALEAAESVRHPFSIGYALCLASSLAQCRDDAINAKRFAEEALALSEKYHFPYWHAWAKIILGWVEAVDGSSDEGIKLLIDGMERYKLANAAQMRGYSLSLLSHAYLKAGRPKDAAATAQTAIVEAERTGIVFYQSEAYRLLGEASAELGGSRAIVMRELKKSLRVAETQRSLFLSVRSLCALLDSVKDSRLRNVVLARAEMILRAASAHCPQQDLSLARLWLDQAKI